jgi:hypothetical protein
LGEKNSGERRGKIIGYRTVKSEVGGGGRDFNSSGVRMGKPDGDRFLAMNIYVNLGVSENKVLMIKV